MHLLHLAILLLAAVTIIAVIALLIVGLILIRYVRRANRPRSAPLRSARPAERRVAFTWNTSFDPNADPVTQQFAAVHSGASGVQSAQRTNRPDTTRKEGHDRKRRA